MYQNIDADVIVVGAGVSGLTAAYTLLEKEATLNVLILEASDKIGGRIDTKFLAVKDDTKMAPFDLGGQWLCEDQTKLITLLKKLDIDVIPNEALGKFVVDFNTKFTVQSRNKALNFLNPMDKYCMKKFIFNIEYICKKLREYEDKELVNILSKITMDQFIEINVANKNVQTIIQHMVLMHCGFLTSDISALFYIFFCISNKGIENQISANGLHQFCIKGGAISLCEKLATEFGGTENIITGEKVVKISSFHRYVEVETEQHRYFSYNVIMAIPPKEAMKIDFYPALAQEKFGNAAQTTSIVKFVVTYRTAFWQSHGFSGDVYAIQNARNGPIIFCYDASSTGQPALTGLARITRKSTLKNEFELKDAILNQLQEYFGQNACNPLDYAEKEWCDGPIYGWGVGVDNFVEEFRKAEQQIHWAGAETATDWYGTIAGAVEAGMRSALEVLYDLRPALLTVDDMVILTPIIKKPPMKHHRDPIYSTAVNWHIIVPVALLTILVMWRLKKYFLK